MPKTAALPVWRMKSRADRRFRAGHPWVYSNELQESPKGIEPGALVELHDAAGGFLARGYGNPHSLIAFRALSRQPDDLAPSSPGRVLEKLRAAGHAREILGLSEVSHRLCFGEADGLPGMVIDHYLLVEPEGQVFSVQLHAAGADRLRAILPEILQGYAEARGEVPWERTAVVLRNDLAIRGLEGISEEEPRILREVPGLDPRDLSIRVRSACPGEPVTRFSVDLLHGQKTGFFLDQAANIEVAARRLAGLAPGRDGAPLRVLDLFCYVGQWGAKLAQAFAGSGRKIEVVAVDASAAALERARANIEAQGARCETRKMDILRGLAHLDSGGFDLVICDPPALIQGRKDIPVGTHAYLRLNTEVFRLARPGGAVVSCSCSALLGEPEFLETLGKAARRGGADVRWVARGCQAPDHPMRSEFPEGRYLKAWIGLLSKGEGPC